MQWSIFVWHYFVSVVTPFLTEVLASLYGLFIRLVRVRESVMRTAEQYFKNWLLFLPVHVYLSASWNIFVCIFSHDELFSLTTKALLTTLSVLLIFFVAKQPFLGLLFQHVSLSLLVHLSFATFTLFSSWKDQISAVVDESLRQI